MPKKPYRRASGGTDGEVLALLQTFGSADVDDCVQHLRSFRNKSYSRTAVATLRKVVERALKHPTIAGGVQPQEQLLQVGAARTTTKHPVPCATAHHTYYHARFLFMPMPARSPMFQACKHPCWIAAHFVWCTHAFGFCAGSGKQTYHSTL